MKNFQNIVFYDGDCGLCSTSVQFILKHEKGKEIKFSPLQSEFTKKFFEEHNYPQPDLSTFYFFTNNKLYQKSCAALKVVPFLKWYWQPLRILVILPKFIRDKFYDFIAERRKKLGGSFCVIPTEENQKRFI